MSQPVGVYLDRRARRHRFQRVPSLDTSFADKQPDWTYDEVDSGKTPVERFTDHRTDDEEDLAGDDSTDKTFDGG